MEQEIATTLEQDEVTTQRDVRKAWQSTRTLLNETMVKDILLTQGGWIQP